MMAGVIPKMKNIGLFTLFFLLLFGCTTKEITEKQKEKIRSEIINYRKTIIEPVIFTTLAVCAYRLEKDKWPVFDEKKIDSKLLSDYRIVNSAPYKTKYRVKPSLVNWETEYMHTGDDCIYSIYAGSNKTEVTIEFNGKINLNELEKIENNTSNDLEKYIKEASTFSYIGYKSLEVYEEKEMPERNVAYETMLIVIGETTIRVAVCVILGIAAGDCK